MPGIEGFPWIDVIGYVGGVVTLWGMHRKTMISLRVAVIVGNVGFLAFGILAESYPTLVLHALLAPLNALRLMQMMRLIRHLREAAPGSESLTPLYGFMDRASAKAGSVLFRKGETPDGMIVIRRGTILLEEIETRIGAGEVLGEVGVFTPENRRTCTAVCETDCELLTLSNEVMIQLYLQNPRFGLYLYAPDRAPAVGELARCRRPGAGLADVNYAAGRVAVVAPGRVPRAGGA